MKRLQIFGTGCPKCTKLAENAEAAAKNLGTKYEINEVRGALVVLGGVYLIYAA